MGLIYHRRALELFDTIREGLFVSWNGLSPGRAVISYGIIESVCDSDKTILIRQLSFNTIKHIETHITLDFSNQAKEIISTNLSLISEDELKIQAVLP